MLPFKQNSPDPRSELLALIERLPDTALPSLLDFASYLVERSGPRQVAMVEPTALPRPAKESVVAAMKRLRESYPMLDHGKMLHECSGLMAQHLMQGRAAQEVIDELEEVFARHYRRYAEGCAGDAPGADEEP